MYRSLPVVRFWRGAGIECYYTVCIDSFGEEWGKGGKSGEEGGRVGKKGKKGEEWGKRGKSGEEGGRVGKKGKQGEEWGRRGRGEGGSASYAIGTDSFSWGSLLRSCA